MCFKISVLYDLAFAKSTMTQNFVFFATILELAPGVVAASFLKTIGFLKRYSG